MCLAIPGKVLSIDTSVQPTMGVVSFGGVEKRVCLEWTQDVALGDYVIVHAGFALHKVDPEEAQESLRLLRELAACADEELFH